MHRYFFHVHDGEDIRDHVGQELPDLHAARRHALSTSAELLGEQPDRFWNGDEWKMEVTDDRGLMLFQLLFLAIDAPSIAKQHT